MSLNNPLVTVAVASTLSCAAGSFATYILTKKHMTRQYETLIEDEVNKAKEYYSRLNKTGDYADPVSAAEKLIDEEAAEESEGLSEDEQRLADKYADKRDFEVDERDYVNYNKIARNYGGEAQDELPPRGVYKPNPGESIEEFEQRLIDNAKAKIEETIERSEDSGINKEEEDVVKRRNIFTDRKPSGTFEPLDRSARDSNRPYIIELMEYINSDLNYNQNTLTYFEGDGVLVDDLKQPIQNVNQVVGERNLQFGNGSEDANVVYIRNEDLEVDFEVVRADGRFADEVQKRGQG